MDKTLAISTSRSSLSLKERTYLKWLRKEGFSLSGCTIGTSHPRHPSDLPHATGVRGVVATSKLEPEHVLFHVPKSKVLSAVSTRFAPLIQRALMPSGAALAVALTLENADPHSPWRPYLDMLPDDLDTPLFWSAGERRLLAGTRAYERANAGAVQHVFDCLVAPFYDQISEQLSEGNVILDERAKSLANFARFGSIVLAYSFTVDALGDGNEVVAMLPFADMLNATPTGVNARMCYGDNGGFEMMATETVAVGEELINSYGPRANAELLTRYGYIASHNPDDGVAFSLQEICNSIQALGADDLAVLRACAVVKCLRRAGRIAPLTKFDEGPFVSRETVVEVRRVLRGIGGFGSIECPALWKICRPDVVVHLVDIRMKQLEEADALEVGTVAFDLGSPSCETEGQRYEEIDRCRISQASAGRDVSSEAARRRIGMARTLRDLHREILKRLKAEAVGRLS